MNAFFSKNLKSTTLVAIPIYKEKPDALEIISLKQCLKILADYPIVFFYPQALDTRFYQNICEEFEVNPALESFEDHYFKNIQGYNALLLSKEFYKRFSEYEFMLIYQLDAFVFKDELQEWCAFNYDYIGSPWVYDDFVHSYNGVHAPLWSQAHWRKRINYGGNGGFSLRKISSFLRFLRFFPFLTRDFKGNEDGFWSFYTDWYNPFFKIAPAETALQFAFEKHPEQSYQKLNQHLPFGCHAWHKYNINFWKPHLEQFGHQITL